MRFLCKKYFLFSFLSLYLLSFPTLSDTFSGETKVIDGDTIKINNVSIRLHGIDAPENRQKCYLENRHEWFCGIESTKALKKFIENTIVSCKGNKYDRYGRLIGKCYADGKSIESFMVRHGWAVAYRRYSIDYLGEEKEARSNKLGIWKGTFDYPEDWRRLKN